MHIKFPENEPLFYTDHGWGKGEQPCFATDTFKNDEFGPWICTRNAGHDGEHEAAAGESACARWDEDRETD